MASRETEKRDRERVAEIQMEERRLNRALERDRERKEEDR